MPTQLQPCRGCGHLVQSEARFCRNCGAKQGPVVGEPSTARVVTSFFILILGIPASLFAAFVAGSFGACTVEELLGHGVSHVRGDAAIALICGAIIVAVAVFVLCMVKINALLKSL